MPSSARKIVIAFAWLLVVPLAFPQSSTAGPQDDLFRTLSSAITFDQAAISPDATQVAWVENDKDGSAILVPGPAAPGPPRSTAGGHGEGAIAWPPDSKQLAFLSDGST